MKVYVFTSDGFEAAVEHDEVVPGDSVELPDERLGQVLRCGPGGAWVERDDGALNEWAWEGLTLIVHPEDPRIADQVPTRALGVEAQGLPETLREYLVTLRGPEGVARYRALGAGPSWAAQRVLDGFGTHWQGPRLDVASAEVTAVDEADFRDLADYAVRMRVSNGLGTAVVEYDVQARSEEEAAERARLGDETEARLVGDWSPPESAWPEDWEDHETPWRPLDVLSVRREAAGPRAPRAGARRGARRARAGA